MADASCRRPSRLSNSAAAQTATVPFFSDGEGVLQCGSWQCLENLILEPFWFHFGLLGCLGEPMGAFRLKDRFWTDSIAYAIERFGPWGRVSGSPSTLSSTRDGVWAGCKPPEVDLGLQGWILASRVGFGLPGVDLGVQWWI